MSKGFKCAIVLALVAALSLAGCAGTQAQTLENEQQELYDLQAEESAPESTQSSLRSLLLDDEIEENLSEDEPEDEPEGEPIEHEENLPEPNPEPPQVVEQQAAPESVQQNQPAGQPASQAPAVPQAAELPIAADEEGDEVEPEPVDTAAFAREVIRLVNIERAAAGLGTLEANPLIQDAAQTRAQELPALFSHTRPDGREWYTAFGEVGLRTSGSGENIASGHENPAHVVRGWMNSTSHRDNILARNFNHIGVGVYQDENGMLHWVQLFVASLG